MIKGVTSSGFKYEIDERRVNDWTVTTATVDLAKNPKDTDAQLKFFEGLRFFVGKDIEQQLVAYLSERDGYADSDILAQEIGEIFRTAKEAFDENKRKNLTSSSAVSQPMRDLSSATSPKPTEYTIINQSQSNSQQPYVPVYERIAE